jgi:hypothetical protein
MILDTLEILIEADRSGLESSFKAALTTVYTFVNKMNDQSVNWKQILAGAISPAIISGVASMFALALYQTLQFQGAIKTAGATTSGFGNQLGDMTDKAIDLSRGTLTTAQQAAQGLALLARSELDAATQMYVAENATKVAKLTGMGYLEVIQMLIGAFKGWGITTLPTATKALESLWKASQDGQIAFKDLVTEIGKLGPAFLQGGFTPEAIESIAYQMEQLSKVIPVEDVVSDMTQISRAIDGSNPVLAELLGGLPKIKEMINEEGVVAVFRRIADIIKTGPLVEQQALGAAMNWTESQINSLSSISEAEFNKIAENTGPAITAAKSLTQSYIDSLTELDKLRISWNGFMTDMAQNKGLMSLFTVASALVDAMAFIAKALDILPDMTQGIIDKGFGKLADVSKSPGGQAFYNTLSDILEKTGIGQGLRDLFGDPKGANNATRTGQPLTSQSNTTVSQGPMAMNSGGSTFNNTFIVGGAGGDQTARDIAKYLQTQMHLG